MNEAVGTSATVSQKPPPMQSSMQTLKQITSTKPSKLDLAEEGKKPDKKMIESVFVKPYSFQSISIAE